MSQKIFTTTFLSRVAKRLEAMSPDEMITFASSDFGATEADEIILDSCPDLSGFELRLRASGEGFQFSNACALFERLPITPYQASDPRLWSYLAVKTFRTYMNDLRPLQADNSKFLGGNARGYILSHYLCRSSSIKDLLLHDIGLLWWIPRLTVSESLGEKYRLAREVFSMLDYTRHLLPGTQGRVSALRHAVLEYVVSNEDLFSRFKEKKVRFIMTRLNLRAGVQLLPLFTKVEIMGIIESFRHEIAACVDNG